MEKPVCPTKCQHCSIESPTKLLPKDPSPMWLCDKCLFWLDAAEAEGELQERVAAENALLEPKPLYLGGCV